MRPVSSDRPLPIRATPAPPARPLGATRAYADAAAARWTGQTSAGAVGRDARRAPGALPREIPQAARLSGRETPPGVETEVSIRVFADGGSISVARYMDGDRVVGIEAVIR